MQKKKKKNCDINPVYCHRQSCGGSQSIAVVVSCFDYTWVTCSQRVGGACEKCAELESRVVNYPSKLRWCKRAFKCKEYKNKVLRDIIADMAIKAITEEMAKHIVGIGQDDIKKKINTLRIPSFFYFCLSGTGLPILHSENFRCFLSSQ